jgi:hypothetical protein
MIRVLAALIALATLLGFLFASSVAQLRCAELIAGGLWEPFQGSCFRLDA